MSSGVTLLEGIAVAIALVILFEIGPRVDDTHKARSKAETSTRGPDPEEDPTGRRPARTVAAELGLAIRARPASSRITGNKTWMPGTCRIDSFTGARNVDPAARLHPSCPSPDHRDGAISSARTATFRSW